MHPIMEELESINDGELQGLRTTRARNCRRLLKSFRKQTGHPARRECCRESQAQRRAAAVR
ncbi:MAG: hypothetical protein QOF42_1560 [Gammaproteobacteria bacterium]|nr:hypothetical protein [Gammaproteobacteria bacterium]